MFEVRREAMNMFEINVDFSDFGKFKKFAQKFPAVIQREIQTQASFLQ